MVDQPQAHLARRERDGVLRRALAAYYGDADTTAWPDPVESGDERHGGLVYMCLRDARGKLLAVYRLRRDMDDRPGQLKRLKRWPWDEPAVEE